MSAQPAQTLFAQLAGELRELRDSMVAFEASRAVALRAIAPQYLASATNLLHYLAMRRQDLRTLQGKLASLGLSSLGRAEAHALSSVDAVLDVVCALGGERPLRERRLAPCDLESGAALLDTHTAALFGSEPAGRSVRVMVTVPTEAATDPTLVSTLIESGMDCMRINCAHDDPAAWLQTIQHLRKACEARDRHCSVLMDLAGPKLRTGAVEAGAAVRKIRPKRDVFGRVITPAAVWLTSAEAPAPPPSSAADGVLQVQADWLSRIEPPQKVTLRDARARFRVLSIVDRGRGGLWAELDRTAYVTNGTRISRSAPDDDSATTQISGIAAAEGFIRLVPGDVLLLTRESAVGREPTFGSAGQMLRPARVSCTLPEVFADVEPGQRVCLDDGKIIGIVEAASPAELRVHVRHTPARGARLRSDKGINLPDTRLHLPALTAKDRDDLGFIVRHADLVGLSFVNGEADVLGLIEQLRSHGERQPGIVLKIETQRAFARLPALLMTAMRHDRVGVMIARGDLAVEVGYERLAEVQEEILWICESAHCPVIWATQVLETLAKEGMPARAEITDAAMGHRAECVMLNKGPHIDRALRVLDDILKRMEAHQSKKRAMLRALRLAMDSFDAAGECPSADA